MKSTAVTRTLVACAFSVAWAVVALPAAAGPPFETDDPEPVKCHHVEVDVAYARQGLDPSTTPTWEVDYGPTQDIELSVAGQRGETQFGSAIRFIPETKSTPQVGFLPSVTLKSDGTTETLLPLWLQKTVGSWTVYGGAGISQRSIFRGIALMHNARSGSSLGVELFNETSRVGGTSGPKINIGYIGQYGASHALMLSAGRSLQGGTHFSFYAGYQFIMAPRAHAANCGAT